MPPDRQIDMLGDADRQQAYRQVERLYFCDRSPGFVSGATLADYGVSAKADICLESRTNRLVSKLGEQGFR